MHTLPLSLSLGAVELNVKDLNLMVNFYHKVIGLEILAENEKQVTLGVKKHPLISLHSKPDLSHAHPTHAGLYHFAILYSSRGDLARTIHKILKQTPHFFTGSADHLVSEAFYFNDPEGNGIELYYDRDRSLWQWENNQIKMATLYIDPVEYLSKHAVLEEPDSHVKMGHFHLKVGAIEKAHQFYVHILGFTVTARLPGALFVSVGGYHHHLGLNTWESLGSPARSHSLGLKSIELVLPTKKDIDLLKKKLADNEVEFIEESGSIIFHDPWKNQLKVTSST